MTTKKDQVIGRLWPLEGHSPASSEHNVLRRLTFRHKRLAVDSNYGCLVDIITANCWLYKHPKFYIIVTLIGPYIRVVIAVGTVDGRCKVGQEGGEKGGCIHGVMLKWLCPAKAFRFLSLIELTIH